MYNQCSDEGSPIFQGLGVGGHCTHARMYMNAPAYMQKYTINTLAWMVPAGIDSIVFIIRTLTSALLLAYYLFQEPKYTGKDTFS